MKQASMLFSLVITLGGLLSTPLSKAAVFGFSRITMTPATCRGATGALTIEVTSNPGDQIEYHLVNSPRINITQLNNGVFTGLMPDRDYDITVTNQTTGESIKAEFPVTRSAPIIISNAFIRPVSTRGGSDGFIALTVTGGVPPYLFFLNDREVDVSSLLALRAGTYKVDVTSSANLCFGFDTDTIIVEIKEPAA